MLGTALENWKPCWEQRLQQEKLVVWKIYLIPKAVRSLQGSSVPLLLLPLLLS